MLLKNGSDDGQNTVFKDAFDLERWRGLKKQAKMRSWNRILIGEFVHEN